MYLCFAIIMDYYDVAKNLLSNKLVLTKEKLLIQTGYTSKHFYRTNYKFNNFDKGY